MNDFINFVLADINYIFISLFIIVYGFFFGVSNFLTRLACIFQSVNFKLHPVGKFTDLLFLISIVYILYMFGETL